MKPIEMQSFIGLKKVKAAPMTRGEFAEYMKKPCDSTNQHDEGMLVEYPVDPKSDVNHKNHAGYVSWCPKDVFNKANRQVNGLTFGEALETLKRGGRVARQGWNGKGMFLFLLPAGDNIPTKVIHDPALRKVIETEVKGDTFSALGSIRMFTADKKILTGWLASQTDMLSEDWVILD